MARYIDALQAKFRQQCRKIRRLFLGFTVFMYGKFFIW